MSDTETFMGMGVIGSIQWPMIWRIVLLAGLGVPGAHVLSTLLQRLAKGHLSDQVGMLVQKIVFYGITIFIVVMILNELGFQLGAILGAAGVMGVAIGFAAQTSLSNIISGLFLVGERPFEVGDVVTVGGTTGTVLSIDLLSVKIRTFDNRFVRLPNETMIKTEVTNVTRFPIRRFDVNLGVAYKEDIDRVMAILREIAEKNPHCLDEPEPVLIFSGFGDSSMNILFGVWFLKADFLKLRNSIFRDIKVRFDAEGISIPFPHRTLYAGPDSPPFPVRVVSDPPTERPLEGPKVEDSTP